MYESIESGAIIATLTRSRLAIARFLMLISFVWPFLNYDTFSPGSTVEINFLPALVAAIIAPEILLADGISCILLGGTIAVSAIWGSTDSSLRVLVGAIPCIFLLNWQKICLARKIELIPKSLAYRTLQVFVGFSIIQWFSYRVFSIIPGFVESCLAAIIPRYYGDQFIGTRGVQGWASEPSGAAVTCFAWAVVAVQQDPAKRFRLLVLLGILTIVNGSVYALGLFTMFGIVCILSLKKTWPIIIGAIILLGGISQFARHSARFEELGENVEVQGLQFDVNQEFYRINQIVLPLASFPRIYQPAYVFGLDVQPLGLLPMLVGYGSILGLSLYVRLVFLKQRIGASKSPLLALIVAFMLSFTVPADLIPAIVAFAYALSPRSAISLRETWYQRAARACRQAYATA
jgi:hypothetical protein